MWKQLGVGRVRVWRREMWGSCKTPCQLREALEERRRKERERGSRFHIPCRVQS